MIKIPKSTATERIKLLVLLMVVWLAIYFLTRGRAPLLFLELFSVVLYLGLSFCSEGNAK
jgi:hypothetical protein